MQQLQWLAGLTVGACCLALGGVNLNVSLKESALHSDGLRELATFQTVMAAANSVSSERGPANVAMAAPAEQGPQAASVLALKRAETDIRLVAAAERIADPALVTTLGDMRANLAAARHNVDAVVSLPAGERSPAALGAAIGAMFAAADKAEDLRDRLARGIIAATPQISADVALGASASSLREYAGRLGSHVIMGLRETSPERRAENFAELMRVKGRLDEIHRSMSVYIDGDYLRARSVKDAMEEADRQFFADAAPWAITIASAKIEPDGVTVASFTQRFVAKLRSTEALREAVTTATRERLEALHAAAKIHVLLSSALTAAVFLILLAITIVFRSSLFMPLTAARREIVAIARGQLREPPPMPRLSKEISEMFDCLGVLRERQQRRIALEQDQMRMSQQLKKLAETDALTDLLNRRALDRIATDILNAADRDGRHVAALLFDVDRFKSINDVFGHAGGDAVLTLIARELEPRLRPGDCFARYGGDEFVALLPNTQDTEAMLVAERLREVVSALVAPELGGQAVTASFGVATRPPGSAIEWDTLVRIADRQLYKAKHAGRNRVSAAKPETGGGRAVHTAA